MSNVTRKYQTHPRNDQNGMVFVIYVRGHPKTKEELKAYFSIGKRIQLLLLYLHSWQSADQNIEPADSDTQEGNQVTLK